MLFIDAMMLHSRKHSTRSQKFPVPFLPMISLSLVASSTGGADLLPEPH